MPIYNLKSRDQMLIEVVDALQKNAGITAVSPGSIARAFAEAITTEVSDLYSSFKLSIEQSTLAMATGKNLDAIGELYSVSRRSISDELTVDRLTSNIEFFINIPYSADITIPKGTLVYTAVDNFNDIQYAYELTNNVTILSGLTREYGTVQAKFSDTGITAARNTVVKHNFIGPPGAAIFCNNPKEIYSSLNSESDDNFRRRIIASVRSKGTGTAESLRFAALAVKGVKDVKIREGSYGIGSCDLIVVPESLSGMNALPEVVFTAVSGIKPVGIRINVRMAQRKNVDVTATLTLREGTTSQLARSAEAQARIFLTRYLNSFSIGDSMSIKEMEAQMKFASDLILSATINNVAVDKKNISNTDYRLSDDRSFMIAGAVAVYSVIIGTSNY